MSDGMNNPSPKGYSRWLPRFVQRLVSDPQELDAADLRQDIDRSGATPTARCFRGQRVTITGRLRSVVYNPEGATPTLEGELFDGSGSVRLIWLGRRRIIGVEPGRCLVARGRIADHDGELVIYNPWYELKRAGHD